MSDPVVTLVLAAKDLASPQLKGLQKDLKGAETQTDRMGMAMDRGGLIAKGMLAAGLAAAAYKATEYVGASVAAYREEEVGIAQLGAALAANVPAWQGNTDAVEKSISTRLRSGFADDNMRAALVKLVPATHSVDKAFRLMDTAMDLARLRGISLEEASQALVKVEGGRYRGLEALGIVLKKGTDQEEALAAVQKAAAGQMEAYAATQIGKADRLNNKLDDLQETVGEKLSPALEKATDAALGFFDALDADTPQTLDQRLRGVSDGLNLLNPATWGGVMLNKTLEDAKAKADALAASAERAGRDIGQGWTFKAPDAPAQMQRTMEQVAGVIRGARGPVMSAWSELLAARHSKEDAADRIIIAKAELVAQKQILHSKHATAEEKANARIRIRALQDEITVATGEMKGLNTQATAMGAKFTANYAAGLVKDTDTLRENARHLAHVVRQYLQVNSPSELGAFATQGGPEGWGAKWVQLYARGLGSGSGAVAGAASGLSSSVAVRTPGGGSSSAPAAAYGGGTAVHLHVNSAYPPTRSQIAEWADQLDAEFSRRRPVYSRGA